MSNRRYFRTERSEKRFYKVLDRYLKDLSYSGISFDEDQKDSLVEGLHEVLVEYLTISGVSNPYKANLTPIQILAWSPFIIIRNLIIQNIAIEDLISIASTAIQDRLSDDKVKFDDTHWPIFVRDVSLKQAVDTDIAIWELPLYVAMYTADNVRPPHPWVKVGIQIARRFPTGGA